MPRAIASAPRDWPSRVVILEGERSFPHGNSVPFDLVCKHLPWRSSHPTGLGLPPRASRARLEGLGAPTGKAKTHLHGEACTQFG